MHPVRYAYVRIFRIVGLEECCEVNAQAGRGRCRGHPAHRGDGGPLRPGGRGRRLEPVPRRHHRPAGRLRPRRDGQRGPRERAARRLLHAVPLGRPRHQPEHLGRLRADAPHPGRRLRRRRPAPPGQGRERARPRGRRGYVGQPRRRPGRGRAVHPRRGGRARRRDAGPAPGGRRREHLRRGRAARVVPARPRPRPSPTAPARPVSRAGAPRWRSTAAPPTRPRRSASPSRSSP